MGTRGPLDDAWVAEVCAWLDPLFEVADVGFVRLDDNTSPRALLWEADPVRFARRYPDSGVVRSYGETWPPHCIDFWVYVDQDARRARLSIEGWWLPELYLDLEGDAGWDGARLRAFFARVLDVDLDDLPE